MKKTLIQQLENNEAVLLMYVAGELPEAERAEVEQWLSVDKGMRDELDRLRAVHEQTDTLLREADDAERLPLREDVAVRRVSRHMRKWQSERLQHERRQDEARRGLRYPWWAYPTAAAAAVLLAFLVWWGNSPTVRVPQVVSPGFERYERFAAQHDEDAPALPGEQSVLLAEALQESFDNSDDLLIGAVANESLSELEAEIAALSSADDLDLFSPNLIERTQ